MTNIFGKSDFIVGDSDALIALTFEEDAHHDREVVTLGALAERHLRVVFPATTIAETVTTLQRKLAVTSRHAATRWALDHHLV